MTIDTIRMDGFWGSILAAESVRGCGSVLHGPGGCRITLSGFVAQSVVREFGIREGPFYFNEPRVPCTYLDEEDYINGADYKLSDLLSTMDEKVAFVVQSPGTSLIGDDLCGAAYRSGFTGKVIIQEENHMSEPFHVGYDATISELVRELCKPSERGNSKIVVLGIPVSMDGWEDTVEEIRGYTSAMGLDAVFLGAGCSVDDIEKSGDAVACVTVLPEFCRRTTEAYLRLGIPTVFSEAPVGFDGTGIWIKAVADAAGVDPNPALSILQKSSERASSILRGALGGGLAMRCATYSMDVDSTAALPLARWLYEYLAMFPVEIVAIPWWDDSFLERFHRFLEGFHSEDTMVEALTPTRCDVVFAGGQAAALMRTNGVCSVDIAMFGPSTHQLRFIGRPFLGARGALCMLDRMFELCERE